MFLLAYSSFTFAESPSPTVHWGGFAYPDQNPKLELGFTGNRFTELDRNGRRFNGIRETMGLNFGSISWTEFFETKPNWSTNLTIGAGPTGEQPTKWLQNEFIHDFVFGVPKVPVRRTRNEFDFMVDGSLTYWMHQSGKQRYIFAGGGLSTGSLYHELFIRGGLRRAPIGNWFADQFPEKWPKIIPAFLSGFRASGLFRYGRSYSGSAFKNVAPQTYQGQFSVSWGIYDEELFPFFELESGLTLDSGLFTDFRGDALEEWFVSLITVRIRHFTFETWNDLINQKDFGPTYGGRVMVNIYPCIKRLSDCFMSQ